VNQCTQLETATPMRPIFPPVQLGPRTYEPTCALLVGSFSCYCVCVAPDSHRLPEAAAYAKAEVVVPERPSALQTLDEADSDLPEINNALTRKAYDTGGVKLAEAQVEEPILMHGRKVFEGDQLKVRQVPESCPATPPGFHAGVRRSLSASSGSTWEATFGSTDGCDATPASLISWAQSKTSLRRSSCPVSHGGHANPKQRWWSDFQASQALDDHSSRSSKFERRVSDVVSNGHQSLLRTVRRLSAYARAALFMQYLQGRRKREGEHFEAELLRYLEETRPPATDKLAALGWEDYGTEHYELYCKWLSSPPRILQSVKMRTDRVVESLPAVQVEGDLIQGGLFPILVTVNSFPKWLPGIKSATLLKQLSPLRRIWLCSAKVGFFSFDFVVFVAVVNRLAVNGTIDIILKSPKPASEGQQWLGITVPERTATVRMSLKACGMSYTPVSRDHGLVESQMELADSFPMKRVAVLLIKSCNDRFMPQLWKAQNAFRGSAIEEILNADTQQARQTRQALLRLNQSVEEFLARRDQPQCST